LSGRVRTRLHRKRRKILGGIQDLTWLAENMPESQLENLLTKETLGPFMRALLSLETGQYFQRSKKIMKREDWEKRRKRIVTICQDIIEIFADESMKLAPTAYEVLTAGGNVTTYDLIRAIRIGY
jgi:hypothetical protein